jgi:hypothetical protein
MPPAKNVDSVDVENTPLTVKEVFAWSGAAVTVISLIISGVVAFCRVEGRCDLTDQSIATLRAERTEFRLARDKQVDSLGGRCDALEHNFADLTHTLSDVQSSLAVMKSRQDDMLAIVKKIDEKVNK